MANLEGDRHQSGLDNRYWSLTYHILLKFGVPVRFKFHLGHAWQHLDSYLQWFIPETEHYGDIEKYILRELKEDIKEGKIIGKDEDGEIYLMGLKVMIYPYSGEEPYLEVVERHKLVENFLKYFEEKYIKGGTDGETKNSL